MGQTLESFLKERLRKPFIKKSPAAAALFELFIRLESRWPIFSDLHSTLDCEQQNTPTSQDDDPLFLMFCALSQALLQRMTSKEGHLNF